MKWPRHSTPDFNGMDFKRRADGAVLCASDFAGWVGVMVWIAVLVGLVALA